MRKDADDGPRCEVCGAVMRPQPAHRIRIYDDQVAALVITARWTTVGRDFAKRNPWGQSVPAVWFCRHENGGKRR